MVQNFKILPLHGQKSLTGQISLTVYLLNVSYIGNSERRLGLKVVFYTTTWHFYELQGWLVHQTRLSQS
jgi:hypothetical protein